jgi:hypothetical protein
MSSKTKGRKGGVKMIQKKGAVEEQRQAPPVLTSQEVDIIVDIMQRANLSGEEVPDYVHVFNRLQSIKAFHEEEPGRLKDIINNANRGAQAE